MVRRIPIRAKVAGALAVPLLALVVAAGINVSTNAAVAREVSQQAELASASIGHAGLIGALQDERNLSVVAVLLPPALDIDLDLAPGDLDSARERTDQASIELRHSLSSEDEQLRDDYERSMEGLAGLDELRRLVADGTAAPGLGNLELSRQVFGGYTSVLATLFSSHDRFALAVDDPELRQGDELIHHASHANDAGAQLVAQLLYVGWGPGGIDQPVEVARLAELRRDVESRNAALAANASGPYTPLVDAVLDDPRSTELTEFTTAAIARGGLVDPLAAFEAAPLGPDSVYVGFQAEVVDLLDARADTLHDRADARRRLFIGGAVALVALALLMAWWVSRSITRPMRDLSIRARQIATHRLPAAVQDILDAPPGEDLVIAEPEPIVVRARDEVADVASAFNDVQTSALTLAVEQAALRRNVAESYVNLGRRNQNLLSRLVDAVGELQADETDSRRAAQIRRLDHLATRIRRNAESLLVLSQAGEQNGGQAPVAVADIVRAAMGEIENDDRVMVRSLDPVHVHGRASADLAHLLAELLENGLRHSPPRELVEVGGQRGGAGRGYRITIVDHGLGMTPDDIDRANQRLAGAESFTVTPAKYLGHYVTAVLASRHDIEVSLQGSVVVGIAAQVDLPAALLVDSAEVAAAGGGADGVDGAAGASPLVSGPGADQLRAAVQRLRARRPGDAAPALTAPAAAAPGDAPQRAIDLRDRDRDGDRQPDRAVAELLPGGGVVPPGGRTASGLVRRVRGAHVPVGAGNGNGHARVRTATEPAAPATADGPSSGPVDGEGIQRFLSSLAAGVQRSLDEQGPPGVSTTREDDAH